MTLVDIPEVNIAVVDRGHGTPCWEWQGADKDNGYGTMGVGGRNGKDEYIHRLMYRIFVGDLHGRTQIDHQCNNRICCNPSHLKPSTAGDNVRRGNHPNQITRRTGVCKRGHDLSNPENVRQSRAGGSRRCRICNNQRTRERRASTK